MSDAIISIRTDKTTKQQVAQFAESLGLTVNAFATIILKQAMREGRVVLAPELTPTEELAQATRQARADRKAGRNITAPMHAQDALAHLRSL
ncbi:type II toxin-antitoxin system RelB/DinJ family antitoxin [Candidatus Saccharibacteria bacterium]|nr:MAG: type II toxin-antitoxin system RelB/DinJ family antitoxin [Candidatus Saccharibacteria bacterium]